MQDIGAIHDLQRLAPGLTIHRSPEWRAVDEHEYDVRSAALAGKDGAAGHYLSLDRQGDVARSLHMDSGRYGPAWTEWAGDLTADPPGAAEITGQPASASRLETFARCPFRFFLGHLIKVEPAEKPEDMLVLTPDRRGRLVHAVLEKYLRLRMDGPDDGEPAERDAKMRQALAEVKSHWEAEELIGHPAMWELEYGVLERDLMGFVDVEREIEERLSLTPADAEMSFGYEGKETPVKVGLADGAEISFRGYIDRVDRDADGMVYVFDYKTGKPDSYKAVAGDIVDGGRHLQLALYAQAALARYPDATDARAAYWFVFEDKKQFVPPPEEFSLSDAAGALQDVVGTVAAGIAAGQFPLRPGKPRGREGSFENCGYCPYDAVCPSNRARAQMWDVHSRDPRLAGYVAMAEGEGEKP